VTKPLADSTSVDLTNCDREPIHILGAIQPIGFLIALTADWLVARVSDNVAEFIGRTPDELYGQPLDKIFSPRAWAGMSEAG
jgi:light-regulated signal transduction histidine kinase (bacteriophytochrome)